MPAKLDMRIFKSTDPGAKVMYTLWRFDVDTFLEQYDEASMHPHIFASLQGYPGKWACTLDEGKDISVWDLLMHMEKTFSNKCDYDAMTRTLYEVQQQEDETVEEYMLHIHDAVAVIRRAYPERLPDWVWDLKKDRFYHGLCPYLHDALSFAMAELPKRKRARPTFDTLYTLAKKLEAGNRRVHTSILPAWICIEKRTGTTQCQWAEWQHWMRRGWLQLILSQGRTPCPKWKQLVASMCAWLRQ